MEIIRMIEKVLNIRTFYHKVLAANIANAETPHYKEKYIDFKEALREKINNERDIKVRERIENAKPDGNTVDMERQIAEVTENSLLFNALVQSLTKKFSLMRYIINDGRR